MGIGRLAALFLGLLVFSCRSNPQVLASHVFYLGVKKAVFIVVDDLFEQSACVGCGLFSGNGMLFVRWLFFKTVAFLLLFP